MTYTNQDEAKVDMKSAVALSQKLKRMQAMLRKLTETTKEQNRVLMSGFKDSVGADFNQKFKKRIPKMEDVSKAMGEYSKNSLDSSIIPNIKEFLNLKADN